LHGVLGARPHTILMPQVFSDERRGFGFFAALSYAKRFNDIGGRYGGKPYGVGHFNSFSAKAVHGAEGFGRLAALKARHDPDDIMNPGKALRHMTRYGVAAPPFLFDLAMWALGFLRRMGV